VVYHGVNTERFWPVSPQRPIVLRTGKDLVVLRSKAECKSFFGGNPAHTWLFRADRNMPRKCYWTLFAGVAPVLAAHPDTFLIYHAKTIDGGGNLDVEKSHFPPQIAAKMISTGIHDAAGGARIELLNVLYNAADLYCSTSAEGFGLTIAEAMACGVPAVGLHFSSVPEVIGNDTGEPGQGAGGVTVAVGRLTRNIYAHFWAEPDIEAYSRAVEFLVSHKMRRLALGFGAVEHVTKAFSWETAARQFADIIGASVREEIAA
jgi:glycosyltransferase involved in cell wall biosynthesis